MNQFSILELNLISHDVGFLFLSPENSADKPGQENE